MGESSTNMFRFFDDDEPEAREENGMGGDEEEDVDDDVKGWDMTEDTLLAWRNMHY